MKNNNIQIDQLVRNNIRYLLPYSSARDEFYDSDEQMIFLDANENPNGDSINRYPDPYQYQLKSKISVLKEIPIENILLGNGSDEILDLLIRSFCEPKLDQLITMPPTYGMYDVLAQINDVENVKVYLNPDFQIDTFEILENINNKTKLIFICSPNNPTGNLMGRDEIEFILKNFGGLVIIDEAYIDFSDSESWIKKIDKYPNLVVLQTLSKAYGLAGIRLGIAYANNKIIEILNKIKAPYNVNQLSQNKAMEVLEDANIIKSQLADCEYNKHKFIKKIEDIKCIEKIYPSNSNFILIKVDDAAIRYKQLVQNGIVVRNRSNEPLCANCLRITIGTEFELEKLAQTLKII